MNTNDPFGGGAPLGSLDAYATAYARKYREAGHLDAHLAGLRAVGLLVRASSAPSSPGVPLADGSQVIAHLGPHFHAQPRARNPLTDGDGFSWMRPHDIYTTDPDVCSEGRVLVGTLSFEAFAAWKQAVMAPGVPDSVREAFEAATDSPLYVHDFADPRVSSAPSCQDVNLSFTTPDHITAAFMGNGEAGTIEQARKDATALAAAWNHVRALIAAHPAGQSTGKYDGWTFTSNGAGGYIGTQPAGQSTGQGAGWLEKAKRHHREGKNLGILHRELPDLIATLVAPDRTRTGRVGSTEIPTQGMTPELEAGIVKVFTDASVRLYWAKLEGDRAGQEAWGAFVLAVTAAYPDVVERISRGAHLQPANEEPRA